MLICIVARHYAVEIFCYFKLSEISEGGLSRPGRDYTDLVSRFSESREEIRYIVKQRYQLLCFGYLAVSINLSALLRIYLRKFSCHSYQERFAEAFGYMFNRFFILSVMSVCMLPGFNYDVVGIDQRSVKIKYYRFYHVSPLITSSSVLFSSSRGL